MKWVSWAWAITVNVISVMLVLGIFSNVYEREHRIILAAIGLIYTAVRGQGIGVAYGWFSMLPAVALLERVAAATIQGFEIDKDAHEEVEREKLKHMLKLSIHSVGLSVIWVICVLQLLN